jgi:dinuclear metal center YbgI/SA1388 family protein
MARPLADAVAALEEIAPTACAEPWDNAGLLLAPSRPRAIARVLLAIDATDAVVEEAARERAELLVAYHPVLFEGAKRLRGHRPAEARVVRLLEERIAVYSPHTALDAALGGLNDWLAEGLGAGATEAWPPAREGAPGARPGIVRIRRLARPAPLEALVARVKARLGIASVRVARAAPAGTSPKRTARSAPRTAEPPVTTAAVCAGAGGSVLRDVPADLLVTGEMRHHDILAARARGASVIVCDHSHTERAYLPVLAARLRRALGRGVEVFLSTSDREPLAIE